MAHYAFLDDNNVVTEVITGRDEDDLPEGIASWEDYYGAFRRQTCVRTSYNTRNGVHELGGTPLRGTFAQPGYTYDPDLDEFVAPPPTPGPETP